MRPLSARQILEVCERGRGLPPVRQALLLLEAAHPAESSEQLAAWPVGRRDVQLMSLRARTIGGSLESEAACPACGERIEFSFRTEDLIGEDGEDVRTEPLSIEHDGYDVRFRLPDSNVLMDIAEEAKPEARLLARCLVEARYKGEPVEPDALPSAVVAAIGQAMTEADPQADLQLALTCPACNHAWHALFDVVSYFWAELEAWTMRLMRDVHRLATAYGWREQDILSMSAWRREQYLNLLPA